jgi:phosphate transport system protein
MERHFDVELNALRESLIHMSSLAEEAIVKAIRALVDRNIELAEEVIRQDNTINELEVEIDKQCLRLFALRQPIAIDLRFISSAMKINSQLERIGDEAVNIAERALGLLKEPPLKPLIDIPRLAIMAQEMVKDSIKSFIKKNADLARSVCKRDDEVDDLNTQIFRELLTYMMEDQATISRAIRLIFTGRHLERIADHATNIAEDVIYMVLGSDIRHHMDRRKEEGQE